MSEFAARVVAWQRVHGRHGLPWQGGRDPYPIWLSEVMLQQTQVATVIPYFLRFIAEFPDAVSLARAPLERVLELWSGLGYYSRARHLHAAARVVLRDHAGRVPTVPALLEALPGIGRSTAAAIAVFSAGTRAAILDGNVKRVLCRHEAIDGHPAQPAVLATLWSLAESRLPDAGIQAYTQGLMDLGATVCTRTRPRCDSCPLAQTCAARASGDPAGYPRPRPRRVPPWRPMAPVVILAGDRVLLARRADKGIWGGLWSLPECASAPALADDASALVVQLLGALPAGVAPAQPVPLPGFDHALTHFRLRIEPWLVAGDPAWPSDSAAAPDEPGSRLRWLPLGECAGAALPQPIKRLLLGLAAGA